MRNIFSKAMGVIAGVVALFGVSVTNVPASSPNITGKSAFYLEHGSHFLLRFWAVLPSSSWKRCADLHRGCMICPGM